MSAYAGLIRTLTGCSQAEAERVNARLAAHFDLADNFPVNFAELARMELGVMRAEEEMDQ